jgi:hypothetical protein
VREPYTTIAADSTFRNSTHLGTEYAALLVDSAYRPPARAETLPAPGDGVVAVAVMPGRPATGPVRKALTFGGHEWVIRGAPSDRGDAIGTTPATLGPTTAERCTSASLPEEKTGRAPRWR